MAISWFRKYFPVDETLSRRLWKFLKILRIFAFDDNNTTVGPTELVLLGMKIVTPQPSVMASTEETREAVLNNVLASSVVVVDPGEMSKATKALDTPAKINKCSAEIVHQVELDVRVGFSCALVTLSAYIRKDFGVLIVAAMKDYIRKSTIGANYSVVPW